MNLMPPTPEEIRAFRREMHLTQSQLAAKLDVSRRTVEEWESARNPPPSSLRLSFAALSNGLTPWGVPMGQDGVRRLNEARARAASSRFNVKLSDHGEMICVQGEASNQKGVAMLVAKIRIDNSDDALLSAILSVENDLSDQGIYELKSGKLK